MLKLALSSYKHLHVYQARLQLKQNVRCQQRAQHYYQPALAAVDDAAATDKAVV